MNDAAPAIADEARQWVREHLELGLAAEAVVAALVDQGIARDYAAQVVATVAREAAAQRTFAEGPKLEGGDCIVPVLARIATPRIALLGPLMSAEECAALIAAARPRLKPSTVVDPQSGHDVTATYRGSEGMFFHPRESVLTTALATRFAQLLNLPLAHAEGLQVLRYPAGAESAPHYDFFAPTNEASCASIRRSGQRLATLIVYLNTVTGGGETVFPHLGLSVTPQQGHGLAFEYRNADGALDARSLHAGAPVLSGEKWIVTQWMRSRSFLQRPY